MDFAPDARRYALPLLVLAVPTTLLFLPVGAALGALAYRHVARRYESLTVDE